MDTIKSILIIAAIIVASPFVVYFFTSLISQAWIDTILRNIHKFKKDEKKQV